MLLAVLVNELGSMDLDAFTAATSVDEPGSIDLGSGLEATESEIPDVSFRRPESVKLDKPNSSFESCLEDCAAR